MPTLPLATINGRAAVSAGKARLTLNPPRGAMLLVSLQGS